MAVAYNRCLQISFIIVQILFIVSYEREGEGVGDRERDRQRHRGIATVPEVTCCLGYF